MSLSNLDKRRFSQGGDRPSTRLLYPMTRLQFDWSLVLLCRSNGARLRLNHDTMYLRPFCTPAAMITCCDAVELDTCHIGGTPTCEVYQVGTARASHTKSFLKTQFGGHGETIWEAIPPPGPCCTNHYVRLTLVDIRGRIASNSHVVLEVL